MMQQDTITTYDQHHIIIIKKEIIKLTPTEYKLMKIFIKEHIVQDTTLTQELGNTNTFDLTAKENLEKHINNIRTKIRGFGANIFRIHSYGYILLIST